MRVNCHCQPALLTCLKPPSIHVRKPYQPGKACWGGKSVRSNQGSANPSSHRTRRVAWMEWTLKQVPAPAQLQPGCWKAKRKAVNWLPSFGRKKNRLLIRKKGCHLHFRIASQSHFAYKPRSAKTMTTQSCGISSSNWENKSSQGSFHDLFSMAGSTRQATGMAQPR